MGRGEVMDAKTYSPAGKDDVKNENALLQTQMLSLVGSYGEHDSQ